MIWHREIILRTGTLSPSELQWVNQMIRYQIHDLDDGHQSGIQ